MQTNLTPSNVSLLVASSGGTPIRTACRLLTLALALTSPVVTCSRYHSLLSPLALAVTCSCCHSQDRADRIIPHCRLHLDCVDRIISRCNKLTVWWPRVWHFFDFWSSTFVKFQILTQTVTLGMWLGVEIGVRK